MTESTVSPWKRLLVAGVVLLGVGCLAIAGRIYLVVTGILYGAAAVARVDGVISSLFGIGVAIIAFAVAARARARTPPAPPGDNDQSAGGRTEPSRFPDRVATLTALASVVALVISAVNLFFPVQLPTRPRAACPGAQDRAAAYIGLTAGVNGNNSRKGPAVSYAPNGRFPTDCSIGFSYYCIGESITDSSGTIDKVQRWVTSRWLVIAKQPPGWRSALARTFSGETPESQYITDANITPASSYETLPWGGNNCVGGYPLPGHARLQEFNIDQQTFSARADHAANMGFAVWVPPDQGFTDHNRYLQMYNGDKTEDLNPGATNTDGSKTVAWTYHQQLLANLRPESVAQRTPATVVVLAVPCIADNLPADPTTADLAAYDINSGENPRRVDHIPTGYDLSRLTRTACQANT